MLSASSNSNRVRLSPCHSLLLLFSYSVDFDPHVHRLFFFFLRIRPPPSSPLFPYPPPFRSQTARARQTQSPVGHAGPPGLVRIESDDGAGSEPPYPRDDPLGMAERHGGYVHGGGLRERGPGEILRGRSYLLGAVRRSPVEPPPAAVFLVNDPGAHRGPGG